MSEDTPLSDRELAIEALRTANANTMLLTSLLWHIERERADAGLPSLAAKVSESLLATTHRRTKGKVVDLRPVPGAPASLVESVERAVAICRNAEAAGPSPKG